MICHEARASHRINQRNRKDECGTWKAATRRREYYTRFIHPIRANEFGYSLVFAFSARADLQINERETGEAGEEVGSY